MLVIIKTENEPQGELLVWEIPPDRRQNAITRELNPPVHKRVSVSGRVQGVSFRAAAKQKAEELGLTGFARNEPDGSVLIEVEGPDMSVERFILWCWEGTSSAEVDKVTVVRGELTRPSAFEVL